MIDRIKSYIRESALGGSSWLDYLLVFGSVLAGFYAGWSIARVFALSALVFLILRPVDNVLLGRLSIAFLYLTLLAVILGQAERSEQLIQFSIFFVVLSGILAIYQRTTRP